MKHISPKVSVIVPAYNVESYLGRCLDSIINQSYKNIEIIIINDGSTDNSLSIIKKYAKNDNRITYINQKNKGLSCARNIGIKKSSGKYITFIDSDDELPLYIIKNQVEKIVKNKSDLVISQMLILSASSISIQKLTSSGDFIKDSLQLNLFSSACGKLYKKSIFTKNKIQFPEHTYHEERIIAIMISYFATKITLDNEVGYIYHDAYNTSSITKTTSNKHVKDFFYMLKSVYAFLQEKNIYTVYSEDFVQFYLKLIKYYINRFNTATPISSNLIQILCRFQKELIKSQKYIGNKDIFSYLSKIKNKQIIFLINLIIFFRPLNLNKKELIFTLSSFADTQDINKLVGASKKPFENIISKYIINNKLKKIIIYGAGDIFEKLEKILKRTNIKILHVIDKKAELQKFKTNGYKVKSKSSIKSNPNIPIVVASFAFADEIVKDLKTYIKENNLKNEIYDLHRCLVKG